jgi:two-component system NarL family response regulator
MTIRIALWDDHGLIRDALRTILSAEAGFEIVAEWSRGEEIVAMVARTTPDVLLLDVSLPDINGIEVARKLRKCHPAVKVLALTSHVERVFVEEMLKAGAVGYVAKSDGIEELIRAIRAVERGQNFLSTEATRSLVNRVQGHQSSDNPPSSILTPREREVLKLLAEGLRSMEIAEELGISPGTVEVHRRNLKNKVNAHSTADLTRYAIREGLTQS